MHHFELVKFLTIVLALKTWCSARRPRSTKATEIGLRATGI